MICGISIGAELSGSSYNVDTAPPLRVRLAAGRHRLTIVRDDSSDLAPGDGGVALLQALLVTPARGGGDETLQAVPTARWRSLCGRRLDWIEVVPATRAIARSARVRTTRR